MSSIRNRDESFQWDPSSGIPPFQIHPSTPTKRQRGKNTTRDQKRDIQMANRCGMNTAQIKNLVPGLSTKQILRALDTPATPKKSSGRPPALNADQREHLVWFICHSRRNRRLNYHELAQEFSFWNIGHKAIRTALDAEGFHMRWAMRKPPISEKNRKLRITFAEQYKHWTFAEWATILWSDETWVKDGRHRKTRVMRRAGEEWLPDCVKEKVQRKKGWMWWGSFHGDIIGPGFFWEKDWGIISGATYREHTIPIVAQYLCDIGGLKDMENEIVFMQDNAPGHAAIETRELIASLAIVIIKWPPFSPDLNPIETLRKHMKEWLQRKYGDCKIKSYIEQKERITEAWKEVVTPGLLRELIESMPARMEAVIKAEGRFIPY
ncbi:hypothetical protein WAI453_012690 [Rhynchosporium graminicola]